VRNRDQQQALSGTRDLGVKITMEGGTMTMESHTEDYSAQFQPNGRYEDLSKETLLNLMMGPWYKEQM